jgi:hypothetical protein
VDLDNLPKNVGLLLYTLASTMKPDAVPHISYLTKAVTSEKLDTADRVQGFL